MRLKPKNHFLKKNECIPEIFPLAPEGPPPAEIVNTIKDKVAEYWFLKRTAAPDPPDLPLAGTERNRKALRQYLLDHYVLSTFNTCKPLPMIYELNLCRLILL